MSVLIGSARGDERGKATGGAAGDQKQNKTPDYSGEVSFQSWYKHSKGWVLIRAKSATVREKIAHDMEMACNNPNIGYDQAQNRTLYDIVKKLGYDCGRVNTKCETDCAQLVRVCVLYAGINTPDFYTATEVSVLRSTGAFDIYTESKYTESDRLLKRGDILCTKTKGHTVVVLSDGSDAGGDTVKYCETTLPILERGCKGNAVKTLQKLLIDYGYDVGPDGPDGDFGKNTEAAVKKFQKAFGIGTDGVVGKKTWHFIICREA